MRISTKGDVELSRVGKSERVRERDRERERVRENDDKRYILCEESIQ